MSHGTTGRENKSLWYLIVVLGEIEKVQLAVEQVTIVLMGLKKKRLVSGFARQQ
jgi:hypothetical protein